MHANFNSITIQWKFNIFFLLGTYFFFFCFVFGKHENNQLEQLCVLPTVNVFFFRCCFVFHYFLLGVAWSFYDKIVLKYPTVKVLAKLNFNLFLYILYKVVINLEFGCSTRRNIIEQLFHWNVHENPIILSQTSYCTI